MNFQEALSSTLRDEREARVQCKVCHLLTTLDRADAESLEQALSDTENYGHMQIVRALATIGHNEIKDHSVARHRRNGHGSSDSTQRAGKP